MLQRRLSPRRARSCAVLFALVLGASATGLAQPETPPPTDAEPAAEPAGVPPFGANLFSGNYAAQRENGLNPDYTILPGDRVMVNAWGTVTINDVFGVDTQGNVFVPEIGPIHLQGVRSDQLTDTVRGAIGRVYRGNFGVYTNLLNASPVAVFVTGGVRRPGRYAGIPSDSVLFFLDQAGGIEPSAGSYRHVTVMRAGAPIAEMDLYDFLLRGTLPEVQFTDGDTILVGRRGPSVEVQGAGAAVQVELSADEVPGREVLDVVASTSRATEVTLRGVRGGRPTVRALPTASFAEARLRDGDVVSFREEGRTDHIVVRLEGEVTGPTEIAVRRGARLQDVLNWVPVHAEVAEPEMVHLRRTRVAREQRRSIQDSLDRLERNALLSLSQSQGESQIRVQEAELVRHFVDRARNVSPLGRVVTSSGGAQLNLLLEDGDVVVIPTRTNVVRVGGEVQMSQAVMYRPDLTIRDYVRMAGGFTNRAETSAVILIRPNAEVVFGSMSAEVHPGDELLIPPQIDRKVFQNAIDLSQVIYQIAVAASVLLRI